MGRLNFWQSRSVLPLVASMLISGTAFGRQNPLDPGAPRPAAAQYPAWLKPGVRLTYQVGSGTAPGGARMNEPGVQDAAGSGFSQITILAADDRGVAAETVSYSLFEASPTVQSNTFTGAVGTTEKYGDVWIHPAVLRRTPDRNDQAARVWRLKWKVGQREVDAIGFMNVEGNGSTRYVYELATGLLLSYRSEVADNGGPRGVNNVVNSILVNVRETKLPWMNTPTPAWVKQGGTFTMQGTFAFVTPGVPVMPGQLRQTFTFDQPGRGYVPVKQISDQVGAMGGPPERTESTRVFGAASGLPVWIDPQALRGLQPGRPLDTDPITRHTLVFAGVQNNLIQLVYQNPGERLVQSYDVNTGLLMNIFVQRKGPVSTSEINLQTVR